MLISSLVSAKEITTPLETSFYAKSNSMVLKGYSKKKTTMLKSGFFAHLLVAMPSSNFLMPIGGAGLFTDGWKPGFGFDVGNMFMIKEFDPCAVGVRATWFSVTMSNFNFDGEVLLRSITASPVRIGPYFQFQINKEMAADVFYQLGATEILLLDADFKDIGFDGALGATHELGANFYYKIFTVGIGYGFGNVLDMGASWTSKKERLDYVYRTSTLHVFLGIKL